MLPWSLASGMFSCRKGMDKQLARTSATKTMGADTTIQKTTGSVDWGQVAIGGAFSVVPGGGLVKGYCWPAPKVP